MLHVHQLVNTSVTKRHWSTQEIITLVVEFVTSDPILNIVIQFTFNSMTFNDIQCYCSHASASTDRVLYYSETVVCSRNCCIGCSVSVNIDNALDIVNISLHLIQ